MRNSFATLKTKKVEDDDFKFNVLPKLVSQQWSESMNKHKASQASFHETIRKNRKLLFAIGSHDRHITSKNLKEKSKNYIDDCVNKSNRDVLEARICGRNTFSQKFSNMG